MLFRSVVHFGFRLVKPVPLATIVARIKRAGGRIRDQGEFAPGLPYVFCEDPDGYEVEIWYESPTPADPKPVKGSDPIKKGSDPFTGKRR